MIRRKAEAGLTPWIERARASLVASFARGKRAVPPSSDAINLEPDPSPRRPEITREAENAAREPVSLLDGAMEEIGHTPHAYRD
jgi:hypothetical protein